MITKRKALRISNPPAKEKIIEKHAQDSSIYAGSEEGLLNKVVEVIVKIIKKDLDL